MKTTTKCLLVSLLIGSSSCLRDHTLPDDVNTPLPEAHCQLSNGSPRPYDCEFIIEKLVFLNNDGTTMGEVTPANPAIVLDYTKAKSIEPVVGGAGGEFMTVDVRAIVKRVANPSFTPAAGYLLNWANQPTASTIDTHGLIGSPVSIPVAIGSTREILFELRYIVHTDPGGYKMLLAPLQFFYIENDVTKTQVISTRLSDKTEASIAMRPTIIN